jgi:tight adherence protein B
VRDAGVHDELVQVLALLSASLASGVPPTTAVRCVAEAVGGDGPIGLSLHELVRAGLRGDGLGEVWNEQAARLGSADLAFVGRAWTLSEVTGAPLAEALRSAEEVLRTRRRAQERLASAAAGPRASMAVLASLPAAGPVVGLLFGMSPTSLYLSSPLAIGSLGLGVGLGLFGWWWSRRILASASREPTPGRGRWSTAGASARIRLASGAGSATPWERGRAIDAGEPVGTGALADALVLIALAMRAGLGLAETLTTVGQASVGAVRRDLGAVVAALRWGRSTADAWTYAGPRWRPAALAWHLAAETGAAPADLIERSAARLREEQELAAQRRAARAGVFLVLPLGLGFLPAFACTAVVPVVMALAAGVVAG